MNGDKKKGGLAIFSPDCKPKREGKSILCILFTS